MWGLTVSAADLDKLSRIGIPISVLATSLLGSGHCLAMCGGIAAAAGPRAKPAIAYQLGRLIAYLAVGLLCGTIGARVLASAWSSRWENMAALLVCLLMALTGLSLWREGRRLHWSPLGTGALARRIGGLAIPRVRGASARALLLGLLTPLLPCGWLYGFVWLAAATRSGLSGALVLAMLWLGSLPALAAGPATLSWGAKRLSLSQRKVVGALLIAAALGNLYQKVGLRPLPGAGKTAVARCHGD